MLYSNVLKYEQEFYSREYSMVSKLLKVTFTDRAESLKT